MKVEESIIVKGLIRLIEKIENIPLNYLFIPFLITFYSLLRIEFEALFICSRCGGIAPFYMYTHGASSFIFSYLAGSSVLLFLVREEPLKVLRITAIGFLIVVIPPVIDGLIFERKMLYRYAWYRESGWEIYPLHVLLLKFSSDYVASPGLKGEIWVVSLLSSLYTFFKTKKLWKTLLSFLLTMSIFVFVAYQLVILTKFSPRSPLISALARTKLMGKSGIETLTTLFWGLYSFLLLLLIFFKKRGENEKKIFISSFFLLTPFILGFLQLKYGDAEKFFMDLLHLKYSVSSLFLPLVYYSSRNLLSLKGSKGEIHPFILSFSIIITFILYYPLPFHLIFLSFILLTFSLLGGILHLSPSIFLASSILISLINYTIMIIS